MVTESGAVFKTAYTAEVAYTFEIIIDTGYANDTVSANPGLP
jgi:hypothetical protein